MKKLEAFELLARLISDFLVLHAAVYHTGKVLSLFTFIIFQILHGFHQIERKDRRFALGSEWLLEGGRPWFTSL